MPVDFFFLETLETRSVCNNTQPFTMMDLQVMKDKQYDVFKQTSIWKQAYIV